MVITFDSTTDFCLSGIFPVSNDLITFTVHPLNCETGRLFCILLLTLLVAGVLNCPP